MQLIGQSNHRRAETFYDQHEREWYAEVDIVTGDPCTPLQPVGWTAPVAPTWTKGMFIPPAHVLEMNPKRRGTLRVNYEKWLVEWDRAHATWEQDLQNLAKAQAVGGISLLTIMQAPPKELLDLVGLPPSPPREVIQAARAGNAWALGLSDAVPPKAEALIEALRPTVKARPADVEDEATDDPFAEADLTDVERYEDVAEQYDPLATGGTRTNLSRGKRGAERKGRAAAQDAA